MILNFKKIFLLSIILMVIGCENQSNKIELVNGISKETHNKIIKSGYSYEYPNYTKKVGDQIYMFDYDRAPYKFTIIDNGIYKEYDWNDSKIMLGYCFYWIKKDISINSSKDKENTDCSNIKEHSKKIIKVFNDELFNIGIDITYLPRKINMKEGI